VADESERSPSPSLLRCSAEQLLGSRTNPLGRHCVPLETIRENGGVAVASLTPGRHDLPTSARFPCKPATTEFTNPTPEVQRRSRRDLRPGNQRQVEIVDISEVQTTFGVQLAVTVEPKNLSWKRRLR